MRYYCKNCGSVFEPGYGIDKDYAAKDCPFCGKLAVYELPDYETPEQYQKRTGEPYPNDWPVWFRIDRIYADFTWGICRYITARKDRDICVCAHGPKAPPDDWKPEVVGL